MRRKTVYIETSIVSYACSRTSGLLLVAAQQQYTQAWLQDLPGTFDAYVSELVSVEALQGDPGAAARRNAILHQFPSLQLDDECRTLADSLIRMHSMPAKAKADALHVAIAAVNSIDYLVTWNCTHINNATMKPNIERCCQSLGYDCPVICTPIELAV